MVEKEICGIADARIAKWLDACCEVVKVSKGLVLTLVCRESKV